MYWFVFRALSKEQQLTYRDRQPADTGTRECFPWTCPTCTEAFKMQSGFIAASPDEWHILFDLGVKGKHVYICKYVNLNLSSCISNVDSRTSLLNTNSSVHLHLQDMILNSLFKLLSPLNTLIVFLPMKYSMVSPVMIHDTEGFRAQTLGLCILAK